MLTKNINFKNFSNAKKRTKIFKILNDLEKNFFQSKKTFFSSLSKNYSYSYDKKIVKKFKKFSSFKIVGMGGSILGIASIYQFLKHRIKKNFYFYDNLKTGTDNFQNNKKKLQT